MKLRLVPLSILSLLAISLSCLAQTELVTVVSSKVVTQTAPAPDCSGLTGFQAGVCAAQRQSAQTPTSHTYYTVESERNKYVLVCCRPKRLSLSDQVPVLFPGQHYTLSVQGDEVLLQGGDAAKPFKMELVQAAAIRGAANNGPSTSRDNGPQSKPVATESLPPAHAGVSDLPVSALTFDGNQLLERCNSSLKVADDRSSADKDDLLNAAYCVGYLHAISDNTAVEVELFKKQGNDQVVSNLFCLPKGPTYEQLVRIVVKWMNDNPAKLHQSAWWVVDSALRDAFPCQ